MDTSTVTKFSHDCELMVSGHEDGRIKIWDVKTGNMIKTWIPSDVPVSEVISVEFNHNNKQVVVVSDTITIYNIDNEQSMSLYGYKGEPRTAVFNHDGTMVASIIYYENKIYLWDVKTGNLLIEWEGHEGSVYSVAFNHDGTKLVSGSSDYTIKIWDLKTMENGSNSSFLKELKHTVASKISYNHDGTKILTLSSFSENGAKIWDVETGKVLYTLLTPDAEEVAFNNDGTKIVSIDEFNLKIWDVESGNFLYKIDTPEHIHSIGFNYDNMILLVEDNEHNFNIVTWNLQNMTSQKIPLVYDRSSPKTVIKDSIDTVIKKPWNTNCEMSEKDLYDMVSHSSKRNRNYTYKTQGEEIKVKIYQSTNTVRAMLVSYKLDNIIFDEDSEEQELLISYDILAEKIEIMLVYIGVGKGICTKAVAYTMRSLIDYINRQNKFALYGKVYIESRNPCAAFNCYNRAFRMNGFELNDDDEYKIYKEELKEDVDEISYTFESFINVKQQLMKRDYMIRTRIKKLKEKRKNVQTEIKNIKKLGPKLKF